MSKVILQEFVSANGLASGRNDSVDFIPAATQGDRSFGDRQSSFIGSIDTMLLGRVTYEMFAGHWPNVTSGEDKQFADKLNALDKVVFSRTLSRAPWGKWSDARIVKSDAAKEVEKLRRGSGKDMVLWGSLSLAQALMADGLIDEYQLIVLPVVLAGGRPLFPDRSGLDLKLLDTRSFDRGGVLLAYGPAKAVSR
jgi:dihydrofolate reductase